MPTWVCLLRGVNLGKQRKLPMAALRGALTSAGMTDVRTYLQSGNVIAHSGLRAREQVSDLVRTVIASQFSLDVPVITRRPAQIDEVIAANPFAAQATQRAHLIRVIFLAAVPPTARTDRLMSDSSLKETCRVAGSHVYVDYVRGYLGASSREGGYQGYSSGMPGFVENFRLAACLRERRPASRKDWVYQDSVQKKQAARVSYHRIHQRRDHRPVRHDICKRGGL